MFKLAFKTDEILPILREAAFFEHFPQFLRKALRLET